MICLYGTQNTTCASSNTIQLLMQANSNSLEWYAFIIMTINYVTNKHVQLLGLAIYNAIILDIRLPVSVYRTLLGKSLSFDDLNESAVSLARSLRSLLSYEHDDLEQRFVLSYHTDVEFFGITHHLQLAPTPIPVTQHNKQQFVDEIVRTLLHDSVRWQLDAFQQGFRIVCDGPILKVCVNIL